ncbi:MAG: bifunctional DNA-formamidopyrimidine glycosylase/DNA-(apurinic or apyrimidinic site) lyase [Actinomycetia bacterium]|nr:bifunctional DNA-formamidopyrimidine glycosylase/DNA-(apurinic or apyrimidinic site) lyase [Actinomycetes bacterium]
MPELPEVETVRRQLAGVLVGKTFAVVERLEAGMLRDCGPEQVRDGLPGRCVEEVDRLGKFLVIRLSGGFFLTVHLGMTGQLLVGPDEDGRGEGALRPPGIQAEEDRHRRFLFVLADDDGRRLRLEFRDMRKFGRLHLTAGAPAPRLRDLGPDAWRGSWDREYLARRLRGRTAPLKAFLLDQRHLAGIGNIYADEILWWTELSPLRPSGSLSDEEIARLATEIPLRLGEGVRLLGCSLSDFVDIEGRPGTFQRWLRAYGRHGQICSRCGGVLQRALVGGRGTAYCPGCQR